MTIINQIKDKVFEFTFTEEQINDYDKIKYPNDPIKSLIFKYSNIDGRSKIQVLMYKIREFVLSFFGMSDWQIAYEALLTSKKLQKDFKELEFRKIVSNQFLTSIIITLIWMRNHINKEQELNDDDKRKSIEKLYRIMLIGGECRFLEDPKYSQNFVLLKNSIKDEGKIPEKVEALFEDYHELIEEKSKEKNLRNEQKNHRISLKLLDGLAEKGTGIKGAAYRIRQFVLSFKQSSDWQILRKTVEKAISSNNTQISKKDEEFLIDVTSKCLISLRRYQIGKNTSLNDHDFALSYYFYALRNEWLKTQQDKPEIKTLFDRLVEMKSPLPVKY